MNKKLERVINELKKGCTLEIYSPSGIYCFIYLNKNEMKYYHQQLKSIVPFEWAIDFINEHINKGDTILYSLYKF